MLEASPDRDSSPELSNSFEIYLNERKKKAEAEKMKLLQEVVGKENRTENVHTGIEVTKKRYSKIAKNKKQSLPNKNDSLNDDSFFENEKICENTLTLDNVSSHLIDLTTLDDANESFLKDLMRKKSLNFCDETRLNEIEEPSFLNNISLMSPNKNSPMKLAREHRISTIMEVTETSMSNKTAATSYHTAQSSASVEKSEYYQTANETMDSTVEALTIIKRPTLKPFFDESFNFTKDSLDSSAKPASKSNEMTMDSLNANNSKADCSSSGIDSSYETNDHAPDSYVDESSDSLILDDTLDRIDYMLAQAKLMNEESKKTPQQLSLKNVKTPKIAVTSPASNKASPSPWSTSKIKPPVNHKLTPSTAIGSKNSPLIRFSPVVSTNNSPGNFKLPSKPASTSKIPQFSSNSKKFQHIVSPISRYINHTAELPLSSNAHIEYGYSGRSRNFNFRDSESFCKKSLDTSMQASSLPLRAKTNTTSVKHVIFFLI